MKPIDHEAFYDDGRIYDLATLASEADVEFFLKHALNIGNPVLEIACGTGRVTIPLASNGVEVTGLDISEPMLTWGRKKAEDRGVKIDWIRADCRNFKLNRQFKLIFIALNSMLHLHDLESINSFLGCVRRHLLPDGMFAFSIFNPSIKILSRIPTQKFPVKRFIDPTTGKQITVEETTYYDDAYQVNRTTWYFSSDDQPDFMIKKLNLRCFFPQELDMILLHNGLDIISKWGNYDEKPFASGDMGQIVMCTAALKREAFT